MKTNSNTLVRNLIRPNPWFFAARLVVLVFMFTLVGTFITGIAEYPLVVAIHPDKFTAWGWTPQEMDTVLGHIGLSYQGWIQWSRWTSVGFAILVCGIGFFLFLRKNRDWFGLYLAASFVLFGTLSGNTADIVSTIHPALEPLLTPMGVFAWVSLLLILFIFPNGHFEPGWTRWVGVAFFIAFGVDIIFYHGDTPPPLLLLLTMSLIAVGPVSQVYRYRKVSNAIERQQTRLVMQAIVLVIAVLLLGLIPLFAPDTIDPKSPMAVVMALLTSLYTIIMGLIPLSIAQAILRYHLWDIDLIIRRTLLYGALTANLAGLYYGSVLVFGGLFRAITRQDSPLALVLSTLVIAALVTPLRRRLQMVIDRRFYRQKYNADHAVTTFAAASRSEVEMGALADKLTKVAGDSLQPESISLWLKKPEVNR